ncbi:MAG: hypothetical protein COT73_01815 [Bdellovibrio sp. CG10_big_fil_rev_8_21_14_0_10_47_8]|nr:MAG: hypothetical protein COT73_01815 [Bdellovibrio sp. CG10_big_fil_rev_8_21_14_0_10_47_8]
MRKKYIVLFFLTLSLGFGIGYSRGAFPKLWEKVFGPANPTITILTSEKALIPDSLLSQFEDSFGLLTDAKSVENFHLFQAEAQTSDLLIAPTQWLSEIKELSQPLTLSPNLLSADFRTEKLSSSHFFPLFWKVDTKSQKETLTIWGITSFRQGKDTSKLLEFLLKNPDHLKKWIEHTGLASTLEISNSIEGLAENLRAIHIRDYSLQRLQ